MSDLSFSPADVLQIVVTVLTLAGFYWTLRQRIAIVEKELISVREQALEAIQVGRETARALSDVAVALAGLTGKVETLIEMQKVKQGK
jgi:hypothetical protein